jgi:hypothetical protein
MASHVPFLALRPDEQFSTDVKARDFATVNGNILTPDTAVMDASEAPLLPRVPPASKLPSWVRFPLVVLLSTSLSTLFYTFVADYAGYELAAISREVKGETQVAILVAWKFTELATAWNAGYDCRYWALLHTAICAADKNC